MTALEAMSAGLPILVSANSGFGKALRGLPFGESFVIDSSDPKEWAKAIAAIRQKSRTQRLEEIQRLRRSYDERFSWERQCQALVARMWKLVDGKKLTLLKGNNDNSNYCFKHGENVKCVSHIRISLCFAFMIHPCILFASARASA